MSAPAQKYDVFQAVADPTRREVLRLVAEKERPVSEIAGHFSISRTAVAKHLHILSEAKLIKGRKAGREKLYTLQPETLAELREWLAYFDRFWDNRLSVLKHLIENDKSTYLEHNEKEE
ncbi:metalloregulator ArsR/SmtB family transcription factor [Bacillus infantis]|uniref:ArsR/SmtB family transcription factor n=1 Tax=Bacillus TaxID=1386 RepID=UPI000B9C450E|nr:MULTISPECIES: metalloregulator ArsR/SmtB family transcription factor [Bacillus]MCA1035965.1 metalloregulator ArsR/SmtB family transcription factor [Bacillus infantis]MDT0162820.1 metalloregulator ArsR/SmtB family transcription factor [Bacillus sp. AG4(2022)]OXT16131.1 transcriptional regulator [Bacillus sp. OG2]